MVKRATQQVWKRLIALGFLFPALGLAQDWQFVSDLNGNLTGQGTAGGAPPRILGHPQNQTVRSGEPGAFSVVVGDPRGISWQWRRNGADIPGALGETLLFANTSVADEGEYSVVVANAFGSVTSAPAMLMLDSDGDTLGDSWEQSYFGSLAQNPTGDADGDGVSNGTEFRDGTNPTDNSSAFYRLKLITDGGQVMITPNRLRFTNGESVTLIATALAPHSFHAWGGDIDATNNPLTLTITNDMTVLGYLSSYDLQWRAAGVNGYWHDRGNWRPRLSPAANDRVAIPVSASITNNGPAVCRSLQLGGPGTAPSLFGNGSLTVLESFEWNSGTLAGTGRTLIEEDGTLTAASSGTGGNLTLANGILENRGTVLWLSGNIGLNNSTISNRMGGLFEARGAGAVFSGSGTPRFENLGTFRKTNSVGVTSIDPGVNFNNSGWLEVDSGTLSFRGNITHDTTMEVNAGTTINLSGSFAARRGSIISGEGNLIVGGGNATLAGLLHLNGTHLFSGGAAHLNGEFICTNHPVVISNGTANFNNTSTVPVVYLGGTGGTLGGGGLLVVQDALNWTNGTMSGVGRTFIAPTATLNINNPSAVYLTTRTLDIGGTALWTGSTIDLSNAVITNRPGALLEARSASSLRSLSGVNRVDNAGTFRKFASPGTSTVFIPLNNYGVVDVQGGTFVCNSSLLNNGSVTVAPGATIRIASGSSMGSFDASSTALVEWFNGTFNLNSGAELNGSGLYRLASGSLSFNADVGTQNLDLLGTLTGSGTASISNVMNWTSGTMSGAGRTVIAPSGTLNLSNSTSLQLVSRTLDNGGAVLWNGGNLSLTAAVVTNRPGALFHARNSGSIGIITTAGRFDNAGTFRKSISTGTTTVGGNVAFNNFGVIDVLTGTLFCNGNFVNNGSVNLAAETINRIAGNGSASGSFNAPASALVEWGTSGTFALNSGAQLNGAGLYRANGSTLACNGAVSVANFDLLGGLSGTGALTVNNVMNWRSGTMSGTGRTVIAPGAALNINSAGTLYMNSRTLENGGTTLWTDGNILLGGAVITNRPGGLFHAENYTVIGFTTSGNRFDNAGTFRKVAGNDQTIVDANTLFNNYNTVDIRSGVLSMRGGYVSRADSMLNCALGGKTGTNFGQLHVLGAVQLNGLLRVELVNGFVPAVNDVFQVLNNSSARTGAFLHFLYPSNAVTMQLSNTPSAIFVRVTEVKAVPRPTLLRPEILASDVRLTWTAVSNQTYRLEFAPDLNATNWSPLAGDVTSQSNSASKLDPLTPSNRVYRVRLVP